MKATLSFIFLVNAIAILVFSLYMLADGAWFALVPIILSAMSIHILWKEVLKFWKKKQEQEP